MNNAIKGALISALIMPGLGQIVLLHYKRGTVIIVTVSSILVVTIMTTVQHALIILERFEAAGKAIEMSTIIDTAVQVSAGSPNSRIMVFTFLLIASWLFSVVDAYVIGRNKDRTED